MSDAEAAAAKFFAGMSRPVPPGDAVLGGRQGVQDRADTAAGGNVSPEPEATPEAPDEDDDGLSEGQRWHEEFRAREAERAERMFGGTPMDGVRYDEPEMSAVNEFSLEVPDDLAGNLAEGEGAQITAAFVESGIGRTLANDLVEQGIAAARRGPLAPEVVEQRNAAAMADLTAKWGSKTGEKLQEARDMIAVAEKRWPGIRDFLDRSGLGSDPKLIKQLVARAERRPGRKK